MPYYITADNCPADLLPNIPPQIDVGGQGA